MDEMDVVPIPLASLLGQQVVVHDQLIVLAVDRQHPPCRATCRMRSSRRPVSILAIGARLVCRPSGGRMSVVKILTLGKPATTSSWYRAIASGGVRLE